MMKAIIWSELKYTHTIHADCTRCVGSSPLGIFDPLEDMTKINIADKMTHFADSLKRNGDIRYNR